MRSKKLFKKVLSIVFTLLFVTELFPVSAIEFNDAELIPAKIISEITEMREESVKYFLCDDGSYVAATYSAPVHYQKDGEWEEIDNRLTLSDDLYTTEGGLNVTIPKNLTEGKRITATNKGHTIGFAVKGDEITLSTQASVVSADKLPSAVAIDNELELTAQAQSLSASAMTEAQKIEKHNDEQMTVENQTGALVYKNFRNNSDLEYVVTSNSIKENIVVYNAQSEYIYHFELDSDGLVPVENSNGCICLVEPSNPDEAVFILSTPYMYDSNGAESYDITTSFEPTADGYTLTVEADKDWINASGREFPVVIDPTWTVPNSKIKDAYVINGTFANITGSNTEIRAGQNMTNLARTYMKLEMPLSVPDGSIITGATLSLTKQNYFKSLGQSDISVRVYDCKDVADWDENTVCWNQQPFSNTVNGYLNSGATLLTSVLGSQSKTTYTFNITSAVQNWYETGINKGIMLASSDESVVTQVDFYSSRAILISHRPVFKVNYTLPSISSNTLTFDATGGESSTINVVSSKAWTTSIGSRYSWLTVSNVTDSGFKITAQANPNATERTGFVNVMVGEKRIGGITVTQYGSAATVVLDRDSWDINETGEHSKTVAVASNASWTVSSDSSWITLDKTGGNGDSSFTISVASNSGLTTTRTGTVTVTAGEVVKMIEVTQFDEVSGYFNPVDSDGVSETRSSSEYNHRLAAWAMKLSEFAYNPLTGVAAPLVPGIFMTDKETTAGMILEQCGFDDINVFNNCFLDTVAHTIAHKEIVFTSNNTISENTEGDNLNYGEYLRPIESVSGITGSLRTDVYNDCINGSRGAVRSTVSENILNSDRTTRQLVVIDVRGSETFFDWLTNFGTELDWEHFGFELGAEDVINSLYHGTGDMDGCTNCDGEGCAECMGYIPYYNIENPIFLVTGHSLGAAVANLTAAHLNSCDDEDCCCSYAARSIDDVYCYTFATPNTVDTADESAVAYTNIFNILNNNDVVPQVPRTLDLTNWQSSTWRRHGIDLKFTMPMDVSVAILKKFSTAMLGVGGHVMSTYSNWMNNLPTKLEVDSADEIDLEMLYGIADFRDELGLLPKFFWAKCPVTVTVKNVDGEVLATASSLSTASTSTANNNSGIVSWVTDNDEKVFFLPFGCETVDVEVEAYDYGTMTFAVETPGTGGALKKTYENVSLYPEKTFTTQIEASSLPTSAQLVNVAEDGTQTAVSQSSYLKSVTPESIYGGATQTITVVTDRSVSKVQFVKRSTQETMTYSKTNPQVTSLVDDGEVLIWQIQRYFYVTSYDVGVKIGDTWYHTERVFELYNQS